MAEQPNDASRKSKAEGERWSPDSEHAGSRDSEHAGARERSTDEQGGGITNRSLDEEVSNQESLPTRGESRPGGHAGHGDSGWDESDRDERRSER